MDTEPEKKIRKPKMFQNSLATKDFFKAYKKDYSDTKVNLKTYSHIIQTFNKKIMSQILMEQFEFEMPYNMGSLRIRKQKAPLDTKYLSINWLETKKAGTRIYHLNEHTNQYTYRFLWNKRVVNYKNRNLYSLTVVRSARRMLASILKDEARTIDYYE